MRRPADFSTQPRRQFPGSVERILLAAAGMVLLASALTAFERWRELRRAQDALERTRQELASVRARLQSLDARAGAAEETLASRILLSREAPPQALLAELSALLPPAVRLDDVQMGYGDRLTLALRVRARDSAAYDLFLERLGASPRFAGIVPGEEARGREVTAVLRLLYSERGRS